MAQRAVSQLPMSESEYQSRIIDTALVRGWRLHHCRPLRRADGRHQTPITGHAGFPDLICVRGSRLLVIEVKSERGRVSPEQAVWLDCWRGVPGAEVFIAAPEGWSLLEVALR